MLAPRITQNIPPCQDGSKVEGLTPFTLTAAGRDVPDAVLTCTDAESASDLLDALRLDGYDLFTLRVSDKLMTFWYRGVQLARAKVQEMGI